MLNYFSDQQARADLATKADLSLISQYTNVLYVDNKRTDTYTEVGTYNLPYKTIQAAMDSITGNSSSNRFCIKIATGAIYTEALAINKDFVTLEGYGETILSGAITLTAPHFRLKNLKTTGVVTGTYTVAFLAEISDCSVTTGKWTVSCDKTGAYVQISGGTTIWTSDIELSGVTGVVSCQSGYFEGTHTFTNCYMEIIGFENYGGVINLEADTEVHIGGALCIDTVVNLKAGATAYIDTVSASGITLNNTGGTLHLTTESSSIQYDNTESGLTAENVKAAIDENAASLAALTQYDTITDTANVFTIDMANKQVRNIKAAISDNTAKEIVITNPTVGSEIFVELTYTDGAAITYTMSAGSTLTWLSDSAPTLTDGKVYRMSFFYYAANVWHGNSAGGW